MVVLLLVLLEGDWLEVEDDDEGIELEDWLLREAGDWVLAGLDVLDGVLELFIELDDERSELPEGEALDAFEPDWPHLSIAAWVFGPRTPSIGPGSQPCAFNCCCCWRTDSSPLALALMPEALSEADAWVDDLSSVELDGDCELGVAVEADCDEVADCDLDGDCELVDDEACGWFALEDCVWAYAEPAARTAATAMASFLEVIGCSFRWR